MGELSPAPREDRQLGDSGDLFALSLTQLGDPIGLEAKPVSDLVGPEDGSVKSRRQSLATPFITAWVQDSSSSGSSGRTLFIRVILSRT